MATAGAGGSKGEAVLAFFKERGRKGATRAEAAEAVGCTVARVGEVVRAHGGFVQDGARYSLPARKRGAK
jgi:hypothetical protein